MKGLFCSMFKVHHIFISGIIGKKAHSVTFTSLVCRNKTCFLEGTMYLRFSIVTMLFCRPTVLEVGSSQQENTNKMITR